MGLGSLGIGSFEVKFRRYNPGDPGAEIKLVTSSGSPRILLSPEAALRVAQITDLHLTDPSWGVKMEALARADFNDGTSSLAGSAQPLSI